MDTRRDVFQAIADPTRREIIHLLAGKTMNLNEVAEQFQISRPAISRHIRILSECGMLTIRKQGREHYCSSNPAPLNEVSAWIARYQKFWSTRLDILDEFLIADNTSKKKNTQYGKRKK